MPKTRKPVDDYITYDQFQKAVNEEPDPMWKLCYRFFWVFLTNVSELVGQSDSDVNQLKARRNLKKSTKMKWIRPVPGIRPVDIDAVPAAELGYDTEHTIRIWRKNGKFDIFPFFDKELFVDVKSFITSKGIKPEDRIFPVLRQDVLKAMNKLGVTVGGMTKIHPQAFRRGGGIYYRAHGILDIEDLQALYNHDNPEQTLQFLGVNERQAFREFSKDKHNGVNLNNLRGAVVKKGPTLMELAESILFEENRIEELEDLLMEKQQIIFYGPPGTSKTYVARKFASYFASNENHVKIVQFHPSYSYEDFIEGIRPKTAENGQSVGFSKQPGLFIRLVGDCKNNPNEKFVLVIDEINRGNISKIFGELIYLLEYRDETVFLTYSPDEKFWIPKNLYIIGTMNSADRSIAYIDYALRRRFYFKGFYPEYDLLGKWFEKYPAKLDPKEYPRKIIDTLKRVNEEIQEKFGPEFQIGHSYFMVKDLDLQRLKRIVEYSIRPLLEQYFYGKRDDIEQLVESCNKMLPSLE